MAHDAISEVPVSGDLSDQLHELNQRQQALLHEVSLRGVVSVERLSQRMGVRADTIRRDVRRLSEAGLLDRFEGGVRAISPPIR